MRLQAILRGVLLSGVAVLATAKPDITLKLGKVVVATADGTVESTHKLRPFEPIPSPLALSSPDSLLKISFTMVDESSGSPVPVLPQQAHVMFKDVESGKSVNLPLSVKRDGKAKFDLKVASLPSSLRSSSGTHLLTLLLSSASYTPLQFPFLTLTLPSTSLTPVSRRWSHEGQIREGGLPAFEPEVEIAHAFGQGEKVVGGAKAVVGTLGVLAPWVVLFGLLTQVAPSMKTRSPPALTLVFLLSLVVLEGLIVKYWIHWKIYQFLPWFAGVGAVSTYLGKISLSQIQTRRLSSAIKTAKVTPAATETSPASVTVASEAKSTAVEAKPASVKPQNTVTELPVRSETPASGGSGTDAGTPKKRKGKK